MQSELVIASVADTVVATGNLRLQEVMHRRAQEQAGDTDRVVRVVKSGMGEGRENTVELAVAEVEVSAVID